MPDRLDRFESAFRHAEATLYRPAPVALDRVAYVTDLEGEAAADSMARAQNWLRPTDIWEESAWRLLPGNEWTVVSDLLASLEKGEPDLVVAHRWLREAALGPHHSLGVVLDVLTQTQPAPVLVLPHAEERAEPLRRVMVLTDHLTKRGRLVDWGQRLTATDGELVLVHVEDGTVWDRYSEAIARVPDLDTDLTRRQLMDELLHGPRRFLESAVETLADERPGLVVETAVEVGHGLAPLLEMVDARRADLIVMDTKDEGQLAMHGTAYALAIELAETPLLLV